MSSVVRDAIAILIRDVKKSTRVLKQELERVADARAAGTSDEKLNERAEPARLPFCVDGFQVYTDAARQLQEDE
jgi:hypothetical protein